MDLSEYHRRASVIIEILKKDIDIGAHIEKLKPPDPYGPERNAKLVILGQDPTVKNPESRRRINVVLNLDKSGALKSYLKMISGQIGVNLENDVAAFNIANNFFKDPPASLPRIVLATAVKYWKNIVCDQLNCHPDAVVISLGQPLLQAISCNSANPFVRYYWGFSNSNEPGYTDQFRILPSSDNIYSRNIYPFPHQPSSAKKFYKQTLANYTEFVKSNLLGIDI